MVSAAGDTAQDDQGALMVTIDRSASAVDRPLVGRTDERELVAALLETAAVRGQALLVVGEPGIGKTALLQEAAADALTLGFTLLTAAGVEFEADLTFSGLHQLLLPVNRYISRLPTAQQRVLEAALGQSNAATPDNLQVATATLALLERAAAATPLLAVVDDFHWLDRASARVIAVVARRLGQAKVALLCAVRPGCDDLLVAAGVPQLEIPPLDTPDASRLLDDRFPVLAAGIRHRLLAEAQGNPLALLHLPAALTPQQRSARAALPSPRRRPRACRPSE